MRNRTVDQEQRESSAALRRALSRTLLVLGGAVATTAAAWAISTATASADAPPAPPALPSVEISQLQVPSVVGAPELVEQLADGVGRLLDPDRAKTAVEDFGRDVTQHLTPPPTAPAQVDDGVVGEITAPVEQQPAPPAATAPPAVEVAPEAVAPAVTPTPVVQTAAAPAAEERAPADGTTRRGSPRAATPTPLLPHPQAPKNPFTAPAPVNPGHTSGSGGTDAPTLGLLSAVPADTELLPACALRTDGTRLPVVAQTQPGVIPD